MRKTIKIAFLIAPVIFILTMTDFMCQETPSNKEIQVFHPKHLAGAGFGFTFIPIEPEHALILTLVGMFNITSHLGLFAVTFVRKF